MSIDTVDTLRHSVEADMAQHVRRSVAAVMARRLFRRHHGYRV
jgi:hypothetical protein